MESDCQFGGGVLRSGTGGRRGQIQCDIDESSCPGKSGTGGVMVADLVLSGGKGEIFGEFQGTEESRRVPRPNSISAGITTVCPSENLDGVYSKFE
eukprot:g29050.t1